MLGVPAEGLPPPPKLPPEEVGLQVFNFVLSNGPSKSLEDPDRGLRIGPCAERASGPPATLGGLQEGLLLPPRPWRVWTGVSGPLESMW